MATRFFWCRWCVRMFWNDQNTTRNSTPIEMWYKSCATLLVTSNSSRSRKQKWNQNTQRYQTFIKLSARLETVYYCYCYSRHRTILFVYEYVSLTFQMIIYCFIEKRRFLCAHKHQTNGGMNTSTVCMFEALCATGHTIFAWTIYLYLWVHIECSIDIFCGYLNRTVAPFVRSSFIHEKA